MLRRIPSTPLVCLAVFLLTCLATASWAAGQSEPLEILLKPDNNSQQLPVAQTAKSRTGVTKHSAKSAVWFCPPYGGISKVKPMPAFCPPMMPMGMPPCILPTARQGQWDMSVQVFFARTRGKIQWPRYSWLMGGANYWGYEGADFNDDLALPKHKVIPEFTAKYQFRPNWGIRYSILADEFNGGGETSTSNWWGFWFGNQFFGWGQPVQSKWKHTYSRLGLVYDAVKNCSGSVSVFANWVHTDDRIDVGCSFCGFQTATFSKGGDSAMAGLELQRCLKTAANGGTLSCDTKAGVIFLDDVEGYDVQAGARYSVPLNSGRWGYLKGGYRVVELKKGQSDYIFNHALEGGYMEFGFIF